MEEVGFKKDETPYIIFNCSKCKQYMYVKTTQKTKKCLRCGRHHKVATIINSGEIVNGMTNALNTVKQKQAEFGLIKGGDTPEFRVAGDFKSSRKVVFTSASKIKELDVNEDYSANFKRLLSEVSRSYKKFPYYIIEIMAEEYNIPNNKLKILIPDFLRRGFLKRVRENLFKISF